MKTKLTFLGIISTLLLSFAWSTPAFAHSSPVGCTGSGLGINLFSSLTQAHIGDVISYTAVIFNGGSSGPIVCDASNITASLVTPDGVSHPIALTRTSLSNGESDTYTNVVSYTARMADITAAGTLTATASDTGVIHQNITDSQGGGNQGLNVFVLSSLNVIKQVVNTGGGAATPASFMVHVKNAGVDVAGSPAAGTATPGTSYTIIAGTYQVSEDANASYTPVFSGDCNAGGTVILSGGDTKTCTITNTFVPSATINVVKTVVNDNGRTKTVADFPLFVNGTLVSSGATNVFPANAVYTVTETSDPNYTQTFSGDCDANGLITLNTSQHKFCIVTNNDIPIPVVVPPAATGGSSGPVPIPPLIDVVKVPNPLALPNGPGSVEYTYTVRNIGTVPMTTVTMVGDTCSPITLMSGDTNSNGALDVNETWLYTCTTTLTETHTNTVVATGWATGISSVDIASATVVVGAIPGLPDTGIVPPLIHVTKIPNPLALRVGGGMVTYNYTVTNPGVVSLSNVSVVDNTCNQVGGLSGDANNNNMLDVSETWRYNCSANLTSTTTNTAIASGDANGMTARDFAIATVVVPVGVVVPRLPNTGLPVEGRSAPWSAVILTLIMAASVSIVLVLRKRAF